VKPPKIFQSTENSLHILCSNVRGIVTNWDVIKSIKWDTYDILAFNEIWAIKDFETLKIEGYEIKAVKTRSQTRGGGVIIFGKTELNTDVIDTAFVEGVFESVTVKVGNTHLINIYRPPSGDKQIFFQELASLLDGISGGDIIIMGDFNTDFLKSNNDWNNFCTEYGVNIKIRGITRPASATCLDNFLSNLDGVFAISNLCIADHLAIRASVKLNAPVKRTKKIFKYRQMKEGNWLTFKNEIHNLKITGDSINIKWDNLSLAVKEAVEASFPLRKASHIYKFNMSRALLRSRDKKNKLLREYKSGRIAKEVYIRYNQIYRKLIALEQEKSFRNKINEAGNCGKKKWKVLKKELLLEKDTNKIAGILVNDELIENEYKIAESFKNHFETCATNLASNLPPSRDTSTIMNPGAEWSFTKINERDIVRIIKSLQNKNSCGADLLSNRMLKAEKYAFAKLLKPLINECIETGIFPDTLKRAIVIPIFKKGATNNLNNYRPISLLPVMSKVFEKVINSQLSAVTEAEFIDDNQFGFRKEHSTEDALIKFANMVQRELSQNKHVVSVFVDVSKAFDSCDHDILLTKIKRTGLDNKGIKLLASYLKDREQMVMVNGISGGSFKINIGVGQGTILGPTFFKIYIMDLHLHTELFTIKFADDSNFIGTGNTKDAVELLVNNELAKIAEWFKNNKLTLHPSKSKFMVHSRDKLVALTLDGTSLQRSGYGLQEESVKMLGLEIDENLDWKVHIRSVIKKISKGSYILWRYRKKLSTELKKTIYESFVRCHLLYGITVWGGAALNLIKPLEKSLSKIWAKFGQRRMHTLNRLKKYGILKISDEIKIQECKFVWKWEKKKLPRSLINIIEEKSDNLRGRRFKISRHCKNNSIEYRLANRANVMINTISPIKTKKSLIQKLRKSTLDSYSFNCRRRNCFICRN
jgi:hypothetical protein